MIIQQTYKIAVSIFLKEIPENPQRVRPMTSKCNENLLQTIRFAGGPPSPIARTGAIMHVTMYDIINQLTLPPNQYEPYLASATIATCVPGADVRNDLASVFGAKKILTTIYNDAAIVPDTTIRTNVQDFITSAFDILLGNLTFTSAEQSDSKLYGECIADLVIAERASDGYNVPVAYVPETDPGQ